MATSKPKLKAVRRAATIRRDPPSAGPFADPRLLPGFRPKYLPRCDGGAAPPPATSDRVERRQIEFLAIYYRLNRLYARLQAIRLGAAAEDDQAVLQDIQSALRDRDALEDTCEPEGFLGEPIMKGVFYKDIEFTYAQRRPAPAAGSSSRFSLFIPVPPPEADVEDWIRAHLAGRFPELAAAAPARATRKPPAPKKRAKTRPEPKLKPKPKLKLKQKLKGKGKPTPTWKPAAARGATRSKPKRR